MHKTKWKMLADDFGLRVVDHNKGEICVLSADELDNARLIQMAPELKELLLSAYWLMPVGDSEDYRNWFNRASHVLISVTNCRKPEIAA